MVGLRLGPRVTMVTTLLMAAVLGLSTLTLLRLRRADLESDLRNQAREIATALATGIEPLAPEEAREVLEARIALVAAQKASFQLELLAAGGTRTEDAGWLALIEAATINDDPVGSLFAPPGRAPFYAMAVPLHNASPFTAGRRVVAVLGLKRSTDYIGRAVASTARRVLPVYIGSVGVFGLVLYLLLRSSVVSPLRRLIDALDAVAKGDLSRALLPERDDEIGSLAGRFNAMTNYLRAAREEEARATQARSALETRLRQSEKLATMGQMAAEIAHEVGTPLNVIGGRARAMAKRAADPAEVHKNADIIATQVDRITRIIRQVLAFSRQRRPTVGEVDLPGIVREAADFLDESIRNQRVTLELHLPAATPRVPGHADELQQVCINLMTNALHAMPKGGRLSVNIATLMRRKEGLALAAPAPYVMLEFADTGVGIPVADRERIFEPFFTTKDTGEGTGLGLAVSKGIIKDHDGWVEVGDSPQGGAVFRVFLPTAPVDTASVPPASDAARPRA